LPRIMYPNVSIETERFCHQTEFPPLVKAMRWLGRNNWIPRGRQRVLALLWNPYCERHFRFEVKFFGMRYRGDLANSIDWMVLVYGSYAYHELSLLKDLTSILKREQGVVHFFDIGANKGNHTLFMAGVADRVIAFEPFPEMLSAINDKLSLNGLTNVQVVPVGLGEIDAELSYFPGAGGNPGKGTFVNDHASGFREPIMLPIRNGDRLFDELELPRLDIAKIDVEGYEPFVLRGLSSHLKRDRPAILMEFSDMSKRGLHRESEFRSLFYDDAVFAVVHGRPGCRFHLGPFDFSMAYDAFSTPYELLVLPAERANFRDQLSDSSDVRWR
jgi:FkbM family methyltransferase